MFELFVCSISALVQDLSPHLGAPATVAALGVMDTGVRIMDKLKEIADDDQLVSGLGKNGLNASFIK